MKRTRTCLVLALIVLIGFTPSLPYVFGKEKPDKPDKPKKPKKATEINVLLEYVDNSHFAPDTPIEGVAWTMYDGLGVEIASGVTLADGMISFIVLMAYDQTGDGIHVEFMWQGTLVSINNLVIGGELVLQECHSFLLSPTFLWQDGITPLPAGTVVEIWFDGMLLDTALISAIGEMDFNKVIAGTYTLESVFFSGLEMVVLIDQPSAQLLQTFIISAEFKLVSSFFGNKTGRLFIFLCFSHSSFHREANA